MATIWTNLRLSLRLRRLPQRCQVEEGSARSIKAISPWPQVFTTGTESITGSNASARCLRHASRASVIGDGPASSLSSLSHNTRTMTNPCRISRRSTVAESCGLQRLQLCLDFHNAVRVVLMGRALVQSHRARRRTVGGISREGQRARRPRRARALIHLQRAGRPGAGAPSCARTAQLPLQLRQLPRQHAQGRVELVRPGVDVAVCRRRQLRGRRSPCRARSEPLACARRRWGLRKGLRRRSSLRCLCIQGGVALVT